MEPSLYRVIVSPRAFLDLDDILDYIKRDSPANAIKVVDRLWESMRSLEQMPFRYPVVQGARVRSRAVRRMPVSPFLIYYRVVEEMRVVRVLTVRHGHRSQPKRFP